MKIVFNKKITLITVVCIPQHKNMKENYTDIYYDFYLDYNDTFYIKSNYDKKFSEFKISKKNQ